MVRDINHLIGFPSNITCTWIHKDYYHRWSAGSRFCQFHKPYVQWRTVRVQVFLSHILRQGPRRNNITDESNETMRIRFWLPGSNVK